MAETPFDTLEARVEALDRGLEKRIGSLTTHLWASLATLERARRGPGGLRALSAVGSILPRLEELELIVPRAATIASVQEAVDRLPSRGGLVLLEPIEYLGATGLAWNKDNVSLWGMGANGSELKFTGAGVAIDVGDGVATRNGVSFSNLRFTGNQSVPATGLRTRLTFQAVLDNVSIVDFVDGADLGGGNLRVIGGLYAQNSVQTLKHLVLRNVANAVVVGTVFEGFAAGTAKMIEIAGSGNVDVSILGITAKETHGKVLWVAQGTAGSVNKLTVQGVVATDYTEHGIVANGLGSVVDGTYIGNALEGGAASFGIADPGTRAVVVGNVARGGVVGLFTRGTDQVIAANRLAGSTNSIQDEATATGIVALNSLSGGVPNKASTGLDWFLNRGDDIGLELSEIADPAAPVANRGRMFVRDNGAGKTQLCVRFPTGAVQVIATEP